MTSGDRRPCGFARTEARLRPFLALHQVLAIREPPDDRPSQEEINAAKNAFVLDAPPLPA